MPVPDPHPQSSAASVWRSIRPWTPRFVLTVRELTSVSATFVLSSASARPSVNDDDSDFEDPIEASGTNTSSLPLDWFGSGSLVSDALNRGLSVTVNGSSWKRVLMRMDEQSGEAVIVLFGLMPGRQYDVELGIVLGDGDGEEVVHSRMVTQSQPEGQPMNETDADKSFESVSSSSSSTLVSEVSPRPHQPALTIEEYASALRTQLSLLTAEHSSLQSQLKSARRDSQKADAAVRAEIDTLKRAAEKHSAAEMRGRQKVLALQEAAKQACAATTATEALVAELEASLPGLKSREDAAAALHASTATEAAKSQAELDAALATDRARTAQLQSSLTSLESRLEKLRSKREKLGGETLPELEERLERLVREVALVERDAGAFEVIDTGPVGVGLGNRTVSSSTLSAGTPTRTTPSGFLSRPQQQLPKSPRSLSSRAPPFDPGPAFRHGNTLGSVHTIRPPMHPSARSTSSVSMGMSGSASPASSSTPSADSSPGLPHAHSHAHSVDVAGGGLAPPGLYSPGNMPLKRPVSPARQTSLPVRMPSYAQQR